MEYMLLYEAYKKTAEEQCLQFEIGQDELLHLINGNCYYCQAPPQHGHAIDLINYNNGYKVTNIVPCCKYCNAARQGRSIDDFKSWARQLATTQLAQPQWEEKCWGRVWHRFYDGRLGESLLETIKGWRCSIHRHHSRWNSFISIDATLIIEIFGSTPAQITSNEIIRPGGSTVVPPGIWHRFGVLDSGMVIEMYWTTDGTSCVASDIERIDVGGRL